MLISFRFWWENEGVFTQQQRAELQRHSLSRVICDNSDVREVPLDSFRIGRYPDNLLSCNDIPSLSLEAWREDLSKGEKGSRTFLEFSGKNVLSEIVRIDYRNGITTNNMMHNVTDYCGMWKK